MLRLQLQNRRLFQIGGKQLENFLEKNRCGPRRNWRARREALRSVARLKLLCVKLKPAAARSARLPERGTSGSVQRGPANPARPGREQRYRDCLGCRRSPEVPRIEKQFRKSGSPGSLTKHELSSHSPEMAPANIP